jgi:putative FmdB family regulatory protein
MPTYEYQCECSEEIIEIQRSILDPEVIPNCQKCNKIMKKIYRTFGIELKGSGWYSKGG